jgi:hypothetical protein
VRLFRDQIHHVFDTGTRELEMLSLSVLLSCMTLVSRSVALQQDPHYLTATALVSDAEENARLQCWEFDVPFAKYPTVGMAMNLAEVSNVTYVVLPPRSAEGVRRPPHAMYVHRPFSTKWLSQNLVVSRHAQVSQFC